MLELPMYGFSRVNNLSKDIMNHGKRLVKRIPHVRTTLAICRIAYRDECAREKKPRS